MKTVIVLLTLVSANAFALISPTGMKGTYEQAKEVVVVGYADHIGCEADGGKWVKDEEYCLMPAADTVEVTLKNGKFSAVIDTMTTNYHTCHMEGAATRTGNSLIVSQKAQGFDGKKWVDTVCKVTLNFSGNSLSATSTIDQCQSLCGARGFLDIQRAVRK